MGELPTIELVKKKFDILCDISYLAWRSPKTFECINDHKIIAFYDNISDVMLNDEENALVKSSSFVNEC